MELEQIRDTLLQSIDDSYAQNVAANQEAQKLGEQQLMYSNDARGTLYSGQPTWERAQLASNSASTLADLGTDMMQQKLNVWGSIQNTMDQVTSYEKAAAALRQSAASYNSSYNSSSTSAQSLLDTYNSLYEGDSE